MIHLIKMDCLRKKWKKTVKFDQGDQCGPSDIYILKKVNGSTIGIPVYPKHEKNKKIVSMKELFCCCSEHQTS